MFQPRLYSASHAKSTLTLFSLPSIYLIPPVHHVVANMPTASSLFFDSQQSAYFGVAGRKKKVIRSSCLPFASHI